MKTFFYFDNSAAQWVKGKGWVSPVIFWTEKDSIIEADAAINQFLNIKVEKTSHISCRIIQNNKKTFVVDKQ